MSGTLLLKVKLTISIFVTGSPIVFQEFGGLLLFMLNFVLFDAFDYTLSTTCFSFMSFVHVMKVNSLSRLAQGTPNGDPNVAIVSQTIALKSSALQVSETFTCISPAISLLRMCHFHILRNFSISFLHNSSGFKVGWLISNITFSM
jgi:hypothetical protein